MNKNTTPELYDEQVQHAEGSTAAMTGEEILMNESDLLAGLLDLGNSKDDEGCYRKIQIRRNGVVKVEFRIRPISEDETQTCLRQAHKYATPRPGQPKKILETDNAKFRSLLIYAATVNEDRPKVWDNRAAMNAFQIMQGWEMVDKVLRAGEKGYVLDVIDEISGYGDESEETAKN